MTENQIGTKVIEAAIEVHRELGPGLLETVYEVALSYELELRGLSARRQVVIPVNYKAIAFDEGFRADILVENRLVLELKSVEEVSKAHRKQIQTYLVLTNMKLGYLLNFGTELMKQGIIRAVNCLEEENDN